MKSFQKVLNKSLPFFIFLLALIIRLWNFTDIEFKLDEALAILKASQFWLIGRLPQAGLISSTLAKNPPLFIYLLAIPALISQHPLFITLFFVLTGTLTVVMTFYLLRRYSPILAMFSATLFATSAWPILFSRKIWAQNLLPLFSVLIIYLCQQIYFQKSKKAILPLIILALWAFQIHFSGVLVIPFVLVIFFLSRIKIEAKKLFLGLLLGLLPLLPYLGRQFQNGFADFSFLLGSETQGYFDIHSFTSPFRLVAGFYFARVLGQDYFEFIKSLPLAKFVFAIFNLQSFLVIIGLIISFIKGKKFLSFTLFFSLMMVVSFLSRRPALPFYEELYFPLIFTFAGVALWQLWQFKKMGKMMALFSIILCLGANLVFIGHFYNFVHDKQQINGDYGLVFWKKEALVQKTIKDLKPGLEKKKTIVVTRVIFSIYNFDSQKNEFLSQKELLPLINDEIANSGLGNF